MSSTVSAMLTTAASQIGYTESEGNVTKYWRDLISWGKAPSSYQGQPWCAAFVQWCFKKHGMWWSAQYPYYCPSIEASAKSHGMWHSTPRAGDLALFGFGYNEAVHIGFVEKVIDAYTIQTIEGNTSSSSGGSQNNGGGVYRRRRSRSDVRGYARPSYSTAVYSSTPTSLTKLAVDGYLGPNTVKALQRRCGVTADGVFGPNTAKALQRRLGVTADGDVGPGTVKALQRRVGATVDGVWPSIKRPSTAVPSAYSSTTARLQSKLNAGTF